MISLLDRLEKEDVRERGSDKTERVRRFIDMFGKFKNLAFRFF